MIIRTRDYNDYKSFLPGGPSEQIYHFESAGYFVTYARTITIMSYVIEFKSLTKPATYATDFPGSVALNFPLEF